MSGRRSSLESDAGLSRTSSDEEEEECGAEKVPDDDFVSRQWQKSALNKFVYFRWSTAHSSKNRYKGVVTGHRAVLVPGGGPQKRRRIDYLTIKTFGMSEDTYVVGKDLREFYVVPTKGQMMDARSDEEIRKIAVRRWSARDGWQKMGQKELVVSHQEEKESSEKPCRSQESTAPGTPITKKSKKPKLSTVSHVVIKHTVPPSNNLPVAVWTQHSRRSLASRIPQFAFADFN